VKADKRGGSRFNRGHRTVGGQVKHGGSKGNWIWGWRIVTVNDPAQKVSDGGERAGINLVVSFHHLLLIISSSAPTRGEPCYEEEKQR